MWVAYRYVGEYQMSDPLSLIVGFDIAKEVSKHEVYPRVGFTYSPTESLYFQVLNRGVEVSYLWGSKRLFFGYQKKSDWWNIDQKLYETDPNTGDLIGNGRKGSTNVGEEAKRFMVGLDMPINEDVGLHFIVDREIERKHYFGVGYPYVNDQEKIYDTTFFRFGIHVLSF